MDEGNWTEEVKEILAKFQDFNLLDELSEYAVQFSYFAVACWLGGWISTAISMSKAADQAKRMKRAYYHGLLRQDIGKIRRVFEYIVTEFQKVSTISRRLQFCHND